MAVFGYSEITYQLSNGNIKTDRYLRVANGLQNIDNELLNIGSDTIIDDAYAVTIKG